MAVPQFKPLINQNILIPRGSTVEVCIAGKSGNVRVTVWIAGPGIPPLTQAEHPAAWNSTWSHALARKGGYSVIADIDFLAKAKVDATLQVLDPDGEIWGVPWNVPIQGESADAVTMSYGLAVL